MTRRQLLALTGLPAASAGHQSGGIEKRRAELDRLLARLPESEHFTRWLKESGELPPDFDALPAIYRLQDPLLWDGGGKVSRAGWPRRREQIARLTEQWLLGDAPPPPGNVAGEVLEKSLDGDHEVWKVQLRFGPGQAARLSVTLHAPRDLSKPAPVFLCDSERYREWAAGAMAQGFGFCVHAARDRDDESWAYEKLFGKYGWSSFRRRGWSASRVVDWLLTLPFVDPRRIFIGGHSRSAKQAMAGAAFDERIAGVIASSPGSGGSMPYRYCDQSFFGESAELLTRRFPDWVHPRVRFFCGREDRLPADSHFLYALLAPRPVLMSTATEDAVEGTWTVEQVYKTIQPLYKMLGAEGNLAFRYRPGQHATDQLTAQAYSQFLLAAAGRTGKTVAVHFPFTPYHVWDYGAWAAKHAPKSAPRPGVSPVLSRLEWLLGEGPGYQPAAARFGEGESEEEAKVLGRGTVKAPRAVKFRFGEGVNGYVFAPETGGRRPCVLWLAPFHCSRGFLPAGYRNAELTPSALVAAGFLAAAFDPIGTGGRQLERRGFYAQHPRWSLMGKMVLDVRHAIDALLAFPETDPERIYLYGYALGGMTAVLAAALDARVGGVASVAGFTPWRTDTASRPTGGVRRYSHLYGWLPRLGLFAGREALIPADFGEILGVIAPRPALLIAPQLDRHASLNDVEGAVREARDAYQRRGAKDALELRTPYDENRLTDAMQQDVIAWLKARSGR